MLIRVSGGVPARVAGGIRVALVLAVMLALIPGRAGAQRTGDAVTVDVPNTRVVPGRVISVSGAGWEPDSSVSVVFDGEPVTSIGVGHAGRFSGRVQVPPNAELGAAVLEIRGRDATGEPATFPVEMDIVGAQRRPGGILTAVLVGAAVILIVAIGGYLVIRSRRRRDEAPAPIAEPGPGEGP